MIGASHKRMGRPSRFPQEMIHDLYIKIHDKKEAPRPNGIEHTYCRSWIDGWIRAWYFDNRATQTEECHQLTKSIPAPAGYQPMYELDEDSRRDIRCILEELSDRRRTALILYFGIDEPARTREDIAAIFECSVARIHQLIQEGLEVFSRHSMKYKNIREIVHEDFWDTANDRFLQKRTHKNNPNTPPGYVCGRRNVTTSKRVEKKRLQALLLWKVLNKDSTAHLEAARLERLG